MDFSESDGKPYNSKEEVDRAVSVDAAPSSVCSEDMFSTIPREYFYNFERKKGLAIIFNHYKYSTESSWSPVPPTRNGTHADMKILQTTFKKLNFDVKDYTDPTYNDIIDVLLEVSGQNHSSTSCLVICILTHGDKGGQLFAHDRVYSANDIFCHFTGDVCPALAAAPKLFFIQACRGRNMDDGVQIDGQTSDSIRIPTCANFLIMNSTVDDFVSWREDYGSWFIKALCKELTAQHATMDLLHILTLVNWHVAYNHSSNVRSDPSEDDKKQMPQIISTLTKLVMFT